MNYCGYRIVTEKRGPAPERGLWSTVTNLADTREEAITMAQAQQSQCIDQAGGHPRDYVTVNAYRAERADGASIMTAIYS